MPVIAATLISALSFVPVGVEVLGNRIGVAEVAVAASLIYYASININFAVRDLPLRWAWPSCRPH